MSDDDKRRRRKTKPPVYQVGKGKPPIETRFKKGVSGNPSGKRKRPKTPWEAMEDLLAHRTCAVTIDNQRQQLPIGEALIMRLGNDAMQGKPAAIKIMMDLWTASATRSDNKGGEDLSAADEEVLAALGIPPVDGNRSLPLACEIRVTIDPDGTVSVEADEIDDDLVGAIEADIAEAVAAGADPVKAIDAVLSSMRRDPPSTKQAVSVSESVTSILQKGDGTVEIRSS